jgi:hypothetical protein
LEVTQRLKTARRARAFATRHQVDHRRVALVDRRLPHRLGRRGRTPLRRRTRATGPFFKRRRPRDSALTETSIPRISVSFASAAGFWRNSGRTVGRFALTAERIGRRRGWRSAGRNLRGRVVVTGAGRRSFRAGAIGGSAGIAVGCAHVGPRGADWARGLRVRWWPASDGPASTSSCGRTTAGSSSAAAAAGSC